MENYTRLFFAIPNHSLMIKALEVAQARINQMAIDTIRWINPQHLHITLVYLGTLSSQQLDILMSRLPTVIDYINVFNLKLTDLRWFPDNTKPHTLIIGVELNLALLELVNSLQVCIDSSDIHIKQQAYLPHLSIGKAISNHPIPYFAPQQIDLTGLLKIDRFALMQTQSNEHGHHQYHTLAEFKLNSYADIQ